MKDWRYRELKLLAKERAWTIFDSALLVYTILPRVPVRAMKLEYMKIGAVFRSSNLPTQSKTAQW
jgi:hypothetical protein